MTRDYLVSHWLVRLPFLLLNVNALERPGVLKDGGEDVLGANKESNLPGRHYLLSITPEKNVPEPDKA